MRKNVFQEYMNKHLLTIEDMSQLFGISPSAVWSWCHNTRRPGKKSAMKIIQATKGEITREDLGYG